MKKTFDILPLSPTQWVLVDTTRFTRSGQLTVITSNGRNALALREGAITKVIDFDKTHPVVAAYPKIEGVPLLPESIWKKDVQAMSIRFAYDYAGPMNTDNEIMNLSAGFKAGYEAAGGCTKDDMIDLLSWYASLSPSEKVSVWSKDGSQQGLFTMDNEQLVDRFIEKRSKWPRALEIEVGEDGSLPSENGTIIYNKAIY